ncbi:hypothetical protein AX16_010989 [Volvariella volvacea WC 439]|nr:hypothetical protein AX16_010989 [Volvariella volvacea WC 439]
MAYEWMSFARFKRKAKKWKQIAIDMVEVPYQEVRNDILEEKGIYCLIVEGLRTVGHKDSFAEREDLVKQVLPAIWMWIQTVATIMNGILALMCYLEVLKKAQAEIDSVVKPGHFLNLSDRDSLPYLSALVKEVLWWNTVTPIGKY